MTFFILQWICGGLYTAWWRGSIKNRVYTACNFLNAPMNAHLAFFFPYFFSVITTVWTGNEKIHVWPRRHKCEFRLMSGPMGCMAGLVYWKLSWEHQQALLNVMSFLFLCFISASAANIVGDKGMLRVVIVTQPFRTSRDTQVKVPSTVAALYRCHFSDYTNLVLYGLFARSLCSLKLMFHCTTVFLD